MDFFKYALLASAPLLLVACGAERNTAFNSPVGSSSSTSSISSSSAKSSIASKMLKVGFDTAGCITEHNADATTEFDAFNAKRKMFAWNCVQDTSRMPSSKKLNLVYNYDQVAGCYKKDTKKDDLLYGSLFVETNSDCTQLATPVLKPGYAAEIISFDVNTKWETNSSVGFSFNYTWKNTGTLPLSQYWLQIKVAYADGEKIGQWFGANELAYDVYAFPGDIVRSTDTQKSAYYSFESFKVGQLYDVSFTIADYYGATLATVTKQIVGN